MPRYFFHCRGAENFTDEVGSELPDSRAAQLAAIRQAGEILRGHAGSFDDHPLWRLFVVDENGSAVFVLGFNAVVLPETSQRPAAAVKTAS